MVVEETCKTSPIFIPESDDCGGCEGYGDRITALERNMQAIQSMLKPMRFVTPRNNNDVTFLVFKSGS